MARLRQRPPLVQHWGYGGGFQIGAGVGRESQASGDRTSLDSSPGLGMTVLKRLGWSWRDVADWQCVGHPSLYPSTPLRMSDPAPGWIPVSGHGKDGIGWVEMIRGSSGLTLQIPRGASEWSGSWGLGMAKETDWRGMGLPPLNPSTGLRVSGPAEGWIPDRSRE